MTKFYNVKKLRYLLRDHWLTFVTIGALFIIVILLFSSYKTYKDSKEELTILKEEVNLLKNRSDTLKYNKSLTEDQITVYNKILASLIPESEDYFSIIYALETISQKTGFNIVSYTINLSGTSREKLTLNIEGKGDLEAFKNFLNNYEFMGGRLVTSEQIEFSGANFTNTKVGLNFYAKKFTFNEAVVPQLRKEDVDKLEAIKQKIQISFTDNAPSTDGEYDTKANPF